MACILAYTAASFIILSRNYACVHQSPQTVWRATGKYFYEIGSAYLLPVFWESGHNIKHSNSFIKTGKKKKDLKNGYGNICLKCDNYDLLYCSLVFPTALHLSPGHVSFMSLFCDSSKQNCRLKSSLFSLSHSVVPFCSCSFMLSLCLFSLTLVHSHALFLILFLAHSLSLSFFLFFSFSLCLF